MLSFFGRRKPLDLDLARFCELTANEKVLNYLERVSLGEQKLPLDIATDIQECIYLSQAITSKTGFDFRTLLSAVRSGNWKAIEERLSKYNQQFQKYKESISSQLDVIIKWANEFDLPDLKQFGTMRYKETGLPRDKDKLLTLNAIHLPRKKLTYIPPEVAVLPNIKAICLANNQINELPETVFKMQNVFALDLDNNLIQSIPDEIEGMVSLTSIDLDENNINALSSKLLKLPNLRKLYLRKQKHGANFHYNNSPLSEEDQNTLARLERRENLDVYL